MSIGQVKRESLAKQVANQMEELIANNEYSINDKIPTETELVELFQVSRNTLREAIQSLILAGVLEARQGDGTYVRASNRFEANMKLRLSTASIADVKETRSILEVAIVKLASIHRTEEDLKKIEEALLKWHASKPHSKENSEADLNFHLLIADACHNHILIDLYRHISTHIKNYILDRSAHVDLKNKEVDRLHDELYLAIKHHDEGKASEHTLGIIEI